MIILDTNIASELTKSPMNATVQSWFDGLGSEPLFLTSITVAEMRFGVCALPHGKRRTDLDERLARMFEGVFTGNILAFDHIAAEAYGIMAAQLRSQGETKDVKDLMIASIALVHDATVATRNTKDFQPTGAKLVNPFGS